MTCLRSAADLALLVLGAALLGAAPPASAAVRAAAARVVRSDDAGLRVVVRVDPGIRPGVQHIAADGLPRGAGPGGVDLPFVAGLVAAPPGATLRVSVRSEAHVDLDGVDLAAAPADAPVLEASPPLAVTRPLGILRGVPAHGLRVYPWQYDPAARRLRVHTHLVVDVAFAGGAAARPAGDRDAQGDGLRGAFLNPPRHGGWAGSHPARRGVQAEAWYDPARPWVKLFVDADGVYRVTPAWLRDRGLDPERVDPRTFRLFHLGAEQAVIARGEEDGAFGEGDDLLFYGRYRRAITPSGERDHESEYGPVDTWWLTWGGAPGRRLVEADAAPARGYAPRAWYRATAHFEVDRAFDPLALAPDSLADRWFWQVPGRWLEARDPTVTASQIFTGDLTGRWDDEAYEARVAVALQGRLAEAFGQHHTILSLNGQALEDAYWAGQVSHVVDATVPSSLLADRNRILYQALADRIAVDQLWFNWFRIEFRRRFHAYPGFLAAATDAAPEGHRIQIEGFTDPQVVLFDAANGVRLAGARVERVDSLFAATFEDAPATPPLYVAADSSSLREPAGILDAPSDGSLTAHGADEVILSHPDFAAAAERLAAHRRREGLAVAVVSIEDVFDEFGFGRFDRAAVAAFVQHLYDQWRPRPAYLLLFGDETWDYRGKYTGNRDLKLVPSTYYSARRRGFSPSDFRLALVDGDDLLPDLSVGRLAVDSEEEAEAVVDKVIAYDGEPEPGDWRSRAVYAANWHAANEFSAGLDSLAARYTEPIGLQSVRIYAPDETPLPNPTGKAFLDALNDGALVVNFSGHGAAGVLQYLFSSEYPDWDYLGQVRNGRRLPLMMALSCLNGNFADPQIEGLSELLTEANDGGAIAYISATAISFTSQNDLLAEGLYSQLFAEDRLQFGPVLDVAKARLLAAHPGWVDVPETMQLLGDPAQRLALPPAADYAAVGLTVDADPVLAGATVRLGAVVRNNTRLGVDSLIVALLGRGDDGAVDTLLFARRAAFAGSDSLALDWAVGARRGPYQLALLVDADDRVAEPDEGNNRLDLAVDILAARGAEPFAPADGGQVTPDGVAEAQLEALAPVDADGASRDVACQFALGPDPDFPDSATVLSPAIPAVAGRARWPVAPPPGADPTSPLFWRVRLVDGGVPSPWSAARSFRIADGAAAPDSSAPLRWRQRGRQLLRAGAAQGLALAADGAVVADGSRPPFRPAGPTREDGFTVLPVAGAGVLATDGAFLYTKRWFQDASTVYPGSDVFTRVGTGLGGTIRAGHYGAFGDSTTAGISATWHDGAIYSDMGRCFELERLDTATGRLDTVRVPAGLLDWVTGLPVAEDERAPGQVLHALITSDGRYVYNVSMSWAGSRRAAWGVRVFEPADGWRLVRQFAAPPTQTGFTFLWTDGIFADGERLYLLEYGGQRRVRAVSAVDGAFVGEWTTDQDSTRVISGQYDPVHDRVWLGDLWSSAVYRYARAGARAPGRLTTAAIGPAAAWGRLAVDGAGVEVRVEGETAAGWVAVSQVSPQPGADVDLSGVDPRRFARLRLTARVDTLAASRLDGWSLEWTPMADLEVAAVAGARAAGARAPLRVRAALRNRGLAPAAAAAVRLETAGGRTLIGQPVPGLAPGAVHAVAFDTLEPLAGASPLRLRVVPAGADGDTANDVALLPFLGAPRLAFRAWPEGHLLRGGDPLRPDQALLVEADGGSDGRLVVAVDGAPAGPDSAWTGTDGPRVRVRLDLGRHRVQARLVGAAGDLAVAQLDLEVGDRLRAANVLVSPSPVRDGTAFTFFLSRPAEVAVDLFAVSGRRIGRLGPLPFAAGFGRLPWDGRDAGGALVAAGAYLFVLTARSGDEQVQHRATLAVIR